MSILYDNMGFCEGKRPQDPNIYYRTCFYNRVVLFLLFLGITVLQRYRIVLA